MALIVSLALWNYNAGSLAFPLLQANLATACLTFILLRVHLPANFLFLG